MKNVFLKIPFLFSKKLLLEDLHFCQFKLFVAHYNTKDYSGQWKSIALRSISGEMNEIYAHSTGANNYKNTSLLDNCSYFNKIISSFKCEKESIRLLSLSPNSQIKEHTDLNLGYEDGYFRIHIPIITNPNVLFYINNTSIPMAAGECWYGNFNLPHRVENNGITDRIHLVIDCIRNAWSDSLFAKAGYNFEMENKPPVYNKETKLKIIEALERMHTETSEKLIQQLKSEL